MTTSRKGKTFFNGRQLGPGLWITAGGTLVMQADPVVYGGRVIPNFPPMMVEGVRSPKYYK